MARQKTSALKVITVDDSLIVADRLKEFLSELEQVEFIGNATSIASAMSLMEQQTPDVVILDINLDHHIPMLNGINLLILLRKKYVNMKIIMLTNLTHSPYHEMCLRLGANYFLDKTNDFERIPEIIERFCAEKRD